MSGRLLLHVGLPKTGTTAMQEVLRKPATDAGWLVMEPGDWPMLGWDACGHVPQGSQVVPWSGDGSWRLAAHRASHPAAGRVWMSHENLSGASTERVEQLHASLTPVYTTVALSRVDLGLALVRWHREHHRAGVEPAKAGFATWEQWCDWRSGDPGPDGSAMRPDVVAWRWRRLGVPVVVLWCTPPADAVALMAQLLGVHVPLTAGTHRRRVSYPPHRPLTTESARWCAVAERRINEAMMLGRVADLADIPPLEVDGA